MSRLVREKKPRIYDPHTWLDPVKSQRKEKIIAQRLGEIDPKNRERYQANAQKLEKRCEELVAHHQLSLTRPNKDFVTQHTAFFFIWPNAGLKQLGIAGISPEEPTARQLAEIQQFVKDYKVKTIFIGKSTRRPRWQIVSPRQQGRVKVLDPLEADPQNDKDLLENLEENMATLAKELEE